MPEAATGAANSEASAWLNKPAPDITLELLDGQTLAMSDLRGRLVLLDFWATWCGPCLASLPTLMEIAEQYADEVEFVAVNQSEEPASIQQFLDSRLWKLRVGLDRDGTIGRLLRVNAIPTVLVFDREGVLRHVHVGAGPNLKAELTEVIQQFIE